MDRKINTKVQCLALQLQGLPNNDPRGTDFPIGTSHPLVKMLFFHIHVPPDFTCLLVTC